ncbi:MAG: hypothetical protein HY781_02960 [Chloroflexi bacterium]|nr:hypothetical protein [Chloroflexota bacterium]
MSEIRKFSLLKPTLQTPFHVDFEWWRANDNNWHVALHDMLCPEHQEAFAGLAEGQLIDWVDPETAEVRQMDGLQTTLISHCAQQSGFLDAHTVFIEAIFRLFLATGNRPLTPVELGVRLNRPPDVILKTIAGPRVYKGIRPYNP